MGNITKENTTKESNLTDIIKSDSDDFKTSVEVFGNEDTKVIRSELSRMKICQEELTHVKEKIKERVLCKSGK